MVDIRIQFSISMVIAGVLGELVSVLFYNHHSAWGRRIGERYLITAIVCDAGLVILLKWIMDQYFPISGWEEAAILALCLSTIYATLEAPHCIHDHRSMSHFFAHWLHKFCVLFVIIFVLHHFRHY